MPPDDDVLLGAAPCGADCFRHVLDEALTASRASHGTESAGVRSLAGPAAAAEAPSVASGEAAAAATAAPATASGMAATLPSEEECAAVAQHVREHISPTQAHPNPAKRVKNFVNSIKPHCRWVAVALGTSRGFTQWQDLVNRRPTTMHGDLLCAYCHAKSH